IGEYITDLISSKDVGATKPDERMFNAALAKYGLEKNDVIFIAHDDDELMGAHKLGIRVYAFNYEPRQNLSYLEDEQKLSDFRELEEIVLKSFFNFYVILH
ncbi:MAG: HAD hydrolase-like protein, partial [Nanoarchaeota archaeon]